LNLELPDGAPEILAPGEPTIVPVQITSGTENLLPGTATLHYRYDGGTWLTTPLTQESGDLYSATLPAGTCDDTPEFYFSAQGSGGTTVNNPGNAPTSVYAASVGTVTVLFEDDFETANGWTVQNDAYLTDGAWDRGVPAGGGERADPTEDFDGSGQCYLTDNVAGNSDVDGGTTWLLSPTLDLSGGDAAIHCAVWYTNYFGNDPNNDLFRVQISNNDGGNWVDVVVLGPETSDGWNVQEFIVSDFVTPTNQVRVRFEASDLGDSSVVEAGVDDFEVTRFSCEDATCPGDLDGDGVRDLTDFGLFAAAYGTSIGDPGYNPAADLDSDGAIDLSDFSAFASVYGTPCP
jgi:hypothetical protein